MDWLLIALAVACGIGVGWGNLPAWRRRLPGIGIRKPFRRRGRRRARRTYPVGPKLP